MTQEALKLAEIIEHFDSNDESLPLELLKEISATLRALAQTQEPVGVVNIGDGGNWYFLPLVPTSELPKGTKFYTTPPQRKPLTDDLYNELLFAVGNKCPNETRHQTALRYILQAEKGDEKAAHDIKE